MKVFCNTDKGLLRSNNQDAYANGMFDDGTVWAVVCDGMGGANGGNVASRMAVDYFSASLKSGSLLFACRRQQGVYTEEWRAVTGHARSFDSSVDDRKR